MSTTLVRKAPDLPTLAVTAVDKVLVLRPSNSVHELSSECFDAAWWQKRNEVVGIARGRGTVHFVEGTEGRWALRHYLRGGWMARCSRDRYIWTGLARSRPWRELMLLASMHAGGLPVPRPIGARIVRTGCCYSGDILTECIQPSQSLGGLLRVEPLSQTAWVAIGALLRRFHRHDVRHDDINVGNILRDGEGNFHLIDFDKAHLAPPGDWQMHNLRRLRRSLEKSGRRNSIFHFNPADWEALQAGYGSTEFTVAGEAADSTLVPQIATDEPGRYR
jgi:3-deoxy-D-manno-octulosonic acid kinase